MPIEAGRPNFAENRGWAFAAVEALGGTLCVLTEAADAIVAGVHRCSSLYIRTRFVWAVLFGLVWHLVVGAPEVTRTRRFRGRVTILGIRIGMVVRIHCTQYFDTSVPVAGHYDRGRFNTTAIFSDLTGVHGRVFWQSDFHSHLELGGGEAREFWGLLLLCLTML